MTSPESGPPSARAGSARRRIVLVIAAVAIAILAANLFSGWLLDRIEMDITPRNEPMIHRIILTSAFLYAFLIALPFVPGVEIGIALIVMFGADLAFLVYIFTVVGLTGGFLVGRTIPQAALARAAAAVSLKRTARLIERLEPLSRQQRLELLVANAPTRIVPMLLKYRYLALAISVNIPGNAIIGGGGGIALIAGMTRLFSIPGFLLTIAIAVSPVPILISVLGTDFLR